MFPLAKTIVRGARVRDECRGAHYKPEFPERDDQNWLKHTLACRVDSKIEISYKPVTITKYQPKERVY